ncbi:hypothetical protein F1C16_02875 [Hymenobacter sp. NBH84]|uniref:hypothetical protein n=1 Tax=Hymenobacter sp. NBH84 TaxID=2596915 RepID=UPI00162427E6|nr:hypothetical protein [Hymenobacter sp. NBH84]QNE38567.1 hypothetical protein F1C16_02875 [Hymenobacter sp. NBH84]
MLWLLLVGTATGQTITPKISINPLLHVGELIPLSATLGLEVGWNSRSSVQLLGSYRHFPAQDAEPSSGPKVYLDYRRYLHPPQPNVGLFLSPFVGVGHLRLGLGDLPPPGATQRRRTEVETGALLGHQALFSRLTAEVYAGPAYRWQITSGSFNQSSYSDKKSFLWIRAGFTVGVRLTKG